MKEESAMVNLSVIFKDLRDELERRNFHVENGVANCNEKEVFSAHNLRFTHIPERIRVSLTEKGVYVRIAEKHTLKLSEQGTDRIFAIFSMFFQASEDGHCPEIFLGAEMEATRDLSEIADISTRAYNSAIS